MSPTSSPAPPPGADDPSIAVTVTPPPASGAGQATATVSIPQETWDKFVPPAERPRCPAGGVGRFLCEHSETMSHVAAGIASVVTAIALIVGGMWAYHKFVRGRVYQPRSAVEVKAQWHVLDEVGDVLQVRIAVTNIGASKLTLVPAETGVQVDFPAKAQTTADQRGQDEWWADIRWEPVLMLEGGEQPRTFTILRNHTFIEPGEQVFEDMLLNLGREPTITQIRAQLCWVAPGWLWKNNWLYDYVDQILPPSTAIYERPE